MTQQLQLLQGWQKSRPWKREWRVLRTWLVSFSAFVISSLLIAVAFALLYTVSPTLFASVFPRLFGGIVVIPLFFFALSLFFASFTHRAYKIKAYRKALKKHLMASISGYYSPAGALAVQEHLATVMRGNGLQQSQKRHLLMLGGPGSGKTANLEYAVYQAVSSGQQKTKKLPVLIQMKYYNGFLRNVRVASPMSRAAPGETLLAYLLDDEHAQKSQDGKKSELVGLNHLHSYLPQLIEQGQIVFLCDGMNELESDALTVIHRELTHLMQTTHNAVVMTCREFEIPASFQSGDAHCAALCQRPPSCRNGPR